MQDQSHAGDTAQLSPDVTIRTAAGALCLRRNRLMSLGNGPAARPAPPGERARRGNAGSPEGPRPAACRVLRATGVSWALLGSTTAGVNYLKIAASCGHVGTSCGGGFATNGQVPVPAANPMITAGS